MEYFFESIESFSKIIISIIFFFPIFQKNRNLSRTTRSFNFLTQPRKVSQNRDRFSIIVIIFDQPPCRFKKGREKERSAGHGTNNKTEEERDGKYTSSPGFDEYE